MRLMWFETTNKMEHPVRAQRFLTMVIVMFAAIQLTMPVSSWARSLVEFGRATDDDLNYLLEAGLIDIDDKKDIKVFRKGHLILFRIENEENCILDLCRIFLVAGNRSPNQFVSFLGEGYVFVPHAGPISSENETRIDIVSEDGCAQASFIYARNELRILKLEQEVDCGE